MFPSSLFVLSLTVTLVAAGPCDIYASGNTPCVAAHSTTRYSTHTLGRSTESNGPPTMRRAMVPLCLQAVLPTPPRKTRSELAQRSGRGNHLTRAPPGSADPSGPDNLAPARGAPVMLNGKKAYGVFIAPGTGYRNDATNGIAVFSTARISTEIVVSTMGMRRAQRPTRATCTWRPIYFGSAGGNKGAGNGPWVMADLENGLFSGGNRTANPSHPSMTSRFVPAVVKDRPGHWAIRGGNAVSGQLGTFYSGVRPSGGYNPMKKEGAIILGTGGDNSDRGRGTFYEGVITSGYPSDATENKVQANIVAARYTTSS
ncbi:alpha-L-arabinofuranosidase [Mycena leptocephala]|nr:alpha-L-arabinofuranosidase [Mycena leptocephala]